MEESIEIFKARNLVKKLFSNKKRDSGELVENHPLRVMQNALNSYLATETNKEDIAITALLHDVLEDTNFSEESIKELFGEDILNNVKLLTKEFIPQSQFEGIAKEEKRRILRESKINYLKNIFESEIVKIVKIADRIDNLSTFEGLMKRLKMNSLVNYIEESKVIYNYAKKTDAELAEKLNEQIMRCEKLIKEFKQE